MRFALVLLVVVLAFPISAGAMGHKYCAHPTTYDLTVRLPTEYPVFNKALHYFWGSHWKEAAIVSFGEGGWSPYAKNGQYLGTFQCGDWCRSTYGHGDDLWSQAKAAHAYWLDSRWDGWECVSY